MKLIILTLGFVTLLLLGVLAFATIWIVIDELDIVDNYILWVEDTVDKVKKGFRKKKGG